MKIAVIGSNSFSGASFVAHCLEHEADVIGVSRSPEPHDRFLPYRWVDGSRFTFHQFDLNRDLDEIESVLDHERPEYVVNFAAQGMVGESWVSPEDWFRTNVIGHVLLHDRLRTKDYLSKYVHVSTPEVYGSCEGAVTEHTNYRPSTPYAVSKASCDMSLATFNANYGFPVVFTRAANVYGPAQQPYRIVPRAVIAARGGPRLQLHGGGRSERSFIHIRDVCAATLRIAQCGEPPDIFHLSTERLISIRSLVTLVCEMTGAAFADVVDEAEDRPGKDHAYVLDSSHARDVLAWEPRISLDAGIRETIEWVDRNFAELLNGPLAYEHKP